MSQKQSQGKIYQTEVKERVDGELYIDIPQEILTHLKWDESTPLEWVDNKDGSFTLKRTNE